MADRPDYHRYMASREWAIRKKAIIERAGGMCERCEIPVDRLQVHHLSYEHLGAERDDELLAVCKWCHQYESGRSDVDPVDVQEWIWNSQFTLADDAKLFGGQAIAWIGTMLAKYGQKWPAVLSSAALDTDAIKRANMFGDECVEEMHGDFERIIKSYATA